MRWAFLKLRRGELGEGELRAATRAAGLGDEASTLTRYAAWFDRAFQEDRALVLIGKKPEPPKTAPGTAGKKR